jgi:hypothetical protein
VTLVTICTTGCWTLTTVTSSVSSATYGSPVTLNTTVVCDSGTGCSAPNNPNGGTETFTDGSVTLGTANVSTSSTATLTTSAIPVGSPTTVSAVYSNCSGCIWWGTEVAGTKNLTITAAPTTTTLASNPNPSAYGTSATLTATVTANSPSTAIPTGTVNFKSGGTTITGCGAVTVSGAGQATCALSGVAGGSYSLTAVFTPSTGPTNFVTSTSSTLTQTITAASTTTTVSSSTNGASTVGTSVTFTATVAASGATPVGTVVFKANGNTIAACPSAVTLSSGTATCTTSALAVGSYSVTAVFTPTTSTNFSTSNGSVTQDVYSASAPSIESGLPYGVWVIYVTDSYVSGAKTVTLTVTPSGISVNGGANVSPGSLIEVTD